MNNKTIIIGLVIIITALIASVWFFVGRQSTTPQTQETAITHNSNTHHSSALKIIDKPSKNYQNRIQTIVLHYTAADNNESLNMLTMGEVSSHYLVMQGGQPIYRLVKEDKLSWHAGESFWQGRTHLNDTSIGIEIVNLGINPNHLNFKGFHPYSHFVDYEESQVVAVGKLLQTLTQNYNINPKNIVAHSDIAPSRKADPGAKFPWQRLYREFGVGAWYDESDKQAFLASNLENTTVIKIKEELRQYGYNTNNTSLWDLPTQQVIYAFQLHFNPKNATGIMDRESYAILKALNKKYSN